MEGDAWVELYGGRPTTSRAYNLENPFVLQAAGLPLYGHARMGIGFIFCGYAEPYDGKLYVEVRPDNTLKITFCDLPLRIMAQNNYYHIFSKAKGSVISL